MSYDNVIYSLVKFTNGVYSTFSYPYTFRHIDKVITIGKFTFNSREIEKILLQLENNETIYLTFM